MEGRCTLDTIRMSFGPALRTFSSAVLPAEPGAPLGQRKTGCGSAARAANRKASNVTATRVIAEIVYRRNRTGGIKGPGVILLGCRRYLFGLPEMAAFMGRDQNERRIDAVAHFLREGRLDLVSVDGEHVRLAQQIEQPLLELG